MYQLLQLLNDSYRTIAKDMDAWFRDIPPGAAWNVYSDYAIGNREKANDTLSFVINLQHDTDAAICEYIAAVAPSDIKSTRTASEGLIQYLNCPVCFSITHVVDRESKLLRHYISDENMSDFIPDMRNLIAMWAANAPVNAEYYKRVDAGLTEFAKDMKKKNFSSGLARQVHITAALAAGVFAHLDLIKSPKHIRWISDRDAIFDRYNQLAFDLGYVYFQLLRTTHDKPFDPNLPNFIFALPGMDGVHDYNEQIRLPDYLAGTIADLSLEKIEFTHDKFHPIFAGAFINSKNNAIIEIKGDTERLTTRRLTYQSDEI